ncbi:hypothetical protein BST12_06750 [Mycobacterium angelicum]|uniref:Uncharacterized protein n=1 Tax=Mycobacterium angelicum TaxID=470074 RepID=A0A1X0A1T7_MYCAN|nr:hypothetical protein BST12_06750 [Mycobacterium angelicum]
MPTRSVNPGKAVTGLEFAAAMPGPHYQQEQATCGLFRQRRAARGQQVTDLVSPRPISNSIQIPRITEQHHCALARSRVTSLSSVCRVE